MGIPAVVVTAPRLFSRRRTRWLFLTSGFLATVSIDLGRLAPQEGIYSSPGIALCSLLYKEVYAATSASFSVLPKKAELCDLFFPPEEGLPPVGGGVPGTAVSLPMTRRAGEERRAAAVAVEVQAGVGAAASDMTTSCVEKTPWSLNFRLIALLAAFLGLRLGFPRIWK